MEPVARVWRCQAVAGALFFCVRASMLLRVPQHDSARWLVTPELWNGARKTKVWQKCSALKAGGIYGKLGN
eukprot:1891222-Rhodomonas_salina.1